MQSRLSHIAVVCLAMCYGLVSLGEPLEALARVVHPGPKPQRLTSPKPTKPISGESYVVARRHLPLTKQIELPPHHAVLIESISRAGRVVALPHPSCEKLADQSLPAPLRCRPPPVHLTIA